MTRDLQTEWTPDGVELAQRLARRLAVGVDDSDWDDVRRRAGLGRSRGRWVRAKTFAIAAGVAALVVAPALAISTGIIPWFRGEPAPPTVQAGFGKISEHALPEQIGQRIEVEKATGVVAIESPEGIIRLWTAPTASGGRCRLIQIGDGADARDFSFSCSTLAPGSPVAASYSGFPGRDDYAIVSGEAAAHVNEVGVAFADGSRQTVPILDGYFLGVVDRDREPEALFFEHVSDGVTRVSTFRIPTR